MQKTRIHTLNQGQKLGQSGYLTPHPESAIQALIFGESHNPIKQSQVGAEGHGPHHGIGQLHKYHSNWFLS